MCVLMVVAAYVDRAAAEGDVHKLEAIARDPAQGALDAVALARTGGGELRVSRASVGAWPTPVTCGLAMGLVFALSPGVALRRERMSDQERSDASAVVDHIATVLGRRELVRIGWPLDAADATVVAATETTRADAVLAAFAPTAALASRRARIDWRALEAQIGRARHAA